MSTTWRTAKLGELINLQRGFDLPSQDRRTGQIPIVSSSGISGTHAHARVSGPGVVTGRYGTIGQVFYVTNDFWPLNTTLFVQDFKGNHPRYIYYLLQTLDYQAHNDKSSVPGVNRNHLHQIDVQVAPLPEQRAIAHILGTLDDKIDLNRRMNQTLEALARAIFTSWFVDFDPVRAKAEGRQPEGMDAETAALFPSAFEESPLGRVPLGWRVAALVDAIQVNPARKLPSGVVAPYLDMANMPTTGARALNWYARPAGSGARFMNGDVLLARITPCLENGKTAFVDFLEPGQLGWGSTEYIVLRSMSPLPPEYAYFVARDEAFRNHAIRSMTGSSGRQRVPAQAISGYPVVVPHPNVARHFGEIARLVLAKLKANDDQSRTLAATRDLLLPKLLSGEVRVPDAERLVQAAS